MIKKISALLCCLLPLSAVAQEFAVGQVWQYRQRANEQNSRLYIVKVDSDTQGEKQRKIFHIYIDNLALKNPHIAGGIQTTLPHVPVSEGSLKSSVTKLEEQEKTDLPDISEGYELWKQDWEAGDAGVFTIPVKDLIKSVEKALNEPLVEL
ncbi:hypothetical protein [Neisseria sp. 83E34]|uniref:hypothetical protein n=1 Tax=Neisseria sp. 83E34 TaxID=1692264 RepID=UPI0006CE9AA8|nr:hypothetical protein [Neisseria sp. 83E34]KPN71030.1 hypothetical protein AKG09_09110 [Neisseria sp. 83E34]